jgi:nucleoside-diphosphate-sugar epimerase
VSDPATGFRDRRVLITGGLGFIGSNLAIRLAQAGADVLLADSMLPAYGATLDNIAPVRDRVRVNFSDVRDRHSMAFLVRERDVIFSLAGQVSHSESMRDPETDLDINCRSQLTLLECCRRTNPTARIVFASTRQLYGRPQYLPVDEAHPREPVDVNGINKLAADMYYSLYSNVHGIPTVSLRMTNTYGPRMELANDHKGFVGIFIRKALNGERIQIYGDGSQRRDFNYVDDAVDALLLAAERPGLDGRVFNLGHPRPASLLEFVETLAAIVPLEYEVVPFPPEAKAIDIGDYYGAFERFQAATGWSPQVELPEGLARTVAWYRAHGWPATGKPRGPG